jgi:hypothetical protein
MTTPVDYFKCEVRQFDEIDSQIKTIRDQIKPLTAKVKDLMGKRKELQSGICSFMAENEIDACNLPSGQLEFKETKAVKPVNKAYILGKLEDFFQTDYTDEFKTLNPEEKANAIHNFIYTNREYTEGTALKRKTA